MALLMRFKLVIRRANGLIRSVHVKPWLYREFIPKSAVRTHTIRRCHTRRQIQVSSYLHAELPTNGFCFLFCTEELLSPRSPVALSQMPCESTLSH